MSAIGPLAGMDRPIDLAEACSSYGDIVVLRTEDPDTFATMINTCQIPIVNVGNGMDETPTQAMIDLYTLFKWRPDLLQESIPADQRIQIGIIGLPRQTRTIRSLLLMLAPFSQAIDRVVVFGRQAQPFADGQREELERAGLPIYTTAEKHPDKTLMECLHEELPFIDVLYMHLIQPPEVSRQTRLEAISLLKPNALVLHPEVRVTEISGNLDDSPHNGYFAQARGAVYLIMALLLSILDAPG